MSILFAGNKTGDIKTFYKGPEPQMTVRDNLMGNIGTMFDIDAAPVEIMYKDLHAKGIIPKDVDVGRFLDLIRHVASRERQQNLRERILSWPHWTVWIGLGADIHTLAPAVAEVLQRLRPYSGT